MQMIDVLKRLAELDSNNPSVIKENTQVDECGIMPEMGLPMSAPQPSHPASINMTAGSGEELGDLLTTIMSLAGVAKGHAEPHSEPTADPIGALVPVGGDEGGSHDMSPADSMRSVLDKLHPDDEEGDEGPEEVGAGSDQDDGEERQDVDEYDNTPGNPNDKPGFDADEFAHQENQPGQGDRMDGDRPKAYADVNEAYKDLFAQYKKFVNEN